MATYDLRTSIPSASAIKAGDILNAPYDNQSFTVTLPAGTFALEVWGGASRDAYLYAGGTGGYGRGGYTKGTLTLQAQTKAYIVPGNGGNAPTVDTRINGGSRYGGDASDIRLLSNSINNRIIVAGGGGNGGYYGSQNIAGGYGGGTTGGSGNAITSGRDVVGGGGTQTAGGAGGVADPSASYAASANPGEAGTFGTGGYPDGGGGWYGGGGRFYRNDGQIQYGCGAGGGSGFALTSSTVSNVPSSYASALKDSKYYLTSVTRTSGNASMPNPDGGTMTGNLSSGYVRITVVSVQLTPPSNLTYSNLTETSVKLSWTASTIAGVTYTVMRGTSTLGTTTSTTYTDSTISTGATYTYKVYATKSGYPDSSQISLSVTNPAKLATPTAKTTTYTETSTTISWNAVSGTGVKYNVWRGSTLLTSSPISATTYTDSTSYGAAGKSNTYKVAATASGYYDSAQRSISTTNQPKLATPSLSATYTISSTKISWSAISGTNVKYKVWRNSTYIGEQTATSYTDSTAGAGKSYTYKVTAIGTNAYDSNQASINTSNNGQLATPTAKATTYTESSTKISWNAVTSATSYKVYRGTTSGFTPSSSNLVSTQTGTTYTDTSAGTGKAYYYKIIATASGYYDSGILTISTSNSSKLATPTGLSASYTVSGTTITWNAVTNATAYKVWRGDTLLTSSNTSRSYTDSSGGAGTSYTYYVSATASGYYESEKASVSTSNKSQFATPKNLTASYTKTSTTISWSKVTSPATATVYNVWRGSTSLGTVTSSASTISYTDSSSYGASGKSNTYYVSAAATSSYYESAKASIKASNPSTLATPTGLSASYTKTQTTISWTAVTSATSYKVYRGTTSGFTPSSSTLQSTQAGTSYTDTGADSGKSYTYKVIASNSPTYYDSSAASITTSNPTTLPSVTNITITPTVTNKTACVTITWSAASGATKYLVQCNSSAPVTVTGTSYVDQNVALGGIYSVSIIAQAPNRYDSVGQGAAVTLYARLLTPNITEASQTENSVSIAVSTTQYNVTMVLSRDGVQIATLDSGVSGGSVTYTDSDLQSKKSYVYSVYARGVSGRSYDSLIASITVYVGRDYTQIERQRSYLAMLKRPFFKLCRLRFLYPNGTTAFALDNNPKNRRSKAFIQEGTVNANMQNGQRLTASVTIANANQEFDFNINKIWFGQDIALDEGLILPNGEEYWRQTGVFVIDNPQETINPNSKTVSYNLVDKWADLDGTLDGNLEGTYMVAVNTNIFDPVAALLAEDRGNGRPVDRMNPVFTEYFNGRTQLLPDGSTASMVLSPYTLTIDGDGGTVGAVVLGLGGMVNAWVGYDNTGRLRMEPSQDDILDAQKAVLYRFRQDEVTLLGLAYTIKKEDLFNDYIVVGEQMDDYSQPGGRAENLDPRSDTNINIIGRKTKRESASGFATVQQCKDLAEWRLKRSGVLQKAVNISCSQMFHIELNSLVEIIRNDKPGSPTERHLIQGYSRPLASNGEMTLTVVSTIDFPIATVSEWPPAT